MGALLLFSLAPFQEGGDTAPSMWLCSFMALMRMPSSLLVSMCPVESACPGWQLTLQTPSPPQTQTGVYHVEWPEWVSGDPWATLSSVSQLLSPVWGLGTMWMLRCDCRLQLYCLLLRMLRSSELEISSIPKCDWIVGTWGWGRLGHGGIAHAVCEGYRHVCDQHTQGPWAPGALGSNSYPWLCFPVDWWIQIKWPITGTLGSEAVTQARLLLLG